MSLQPPSAVLFDLDGTLLDSSIDLGNAANTMLERRNQPLLPLQSYRPYIGSGARGILSIAFPQVKTDSAQFHQLCQEFYDIYEASMTMHSRVFEGVDTLLRTLERHHIPWGIVTNKAERFAIPLVAAIAQLQNTPVLICGDTTAQAKPHPLPLQEAAKRLNICADSAIYVGDDKRDMQAGKNAGMTTVAALYGFIASTENTHQWLADYHIQEPLGLLKLIGIT